MTRGAEPEPNFVCPRCAVASPLWLDPAWRNHGAAQVEEECPHCFASVAVRWTELPDGRWQCVPLTERAAMAEAFDPEASYCCPACGERVQVWIDPENGATQEYVEDCPVCCRPNLVRAWIAADGEVRVDVQAE